MPINYIVGVVLLILFWGIAALIMWGAVATGQAFFAMDGIVAKIAGVLIPIVFIVPVGLAFFTGGLTAVGASAATNFWK